MNKVIRYFPSRPVRSGVVDRLLRNLHSASQLFFSSADFTYTNTMGEVFEDKKNAESCDFKALPNDIAQVSIEQYLKDRDNNFKVIDVRTREEYCEDRWEIKFESCLGCLVQLMCQHWMTSNGGRCKYLQTLTCQEAGRNTYNAPSFFFDGFLQTDGHLPDSKCHRRSSSVFQR